MLVLARKVGERIVVGNDIILTVLAVERDRIKLGIEAPAHVPILRYELYESVRLANQEAAKPGTRATGDVMTSVRGLLQQEEP